MKEREKKNCYFIMIRNRIICRSVSSKAEFIIIGFIIIFLLTVFSNYSSKQISYSDNERNEHNTIISNYFSVRKVSGIKL